MVITQMLVGVAVLLLGRRLFWLFVGAVGFMYGLELGTLFLQGASQLVITVAALILGLVGAVLAYFMQRALVALAGFLAGGGFLLAVMPALGWHAGELAWLVFFIGGIIGALLVAAVFDWALIILSALVGAGLIVDPLHLGPPIAGVVFIALAVAGMVMQAGRMPRPVRR
jgi:hypothetical protein